MAVLRLSERWWGHDDASERAETKRAGVHRELNKEIGQAHELFGQIVKVEAFFEASDDVIVQLVDGTFALVHPTWSGRQEPQSFPTMERLGDEAAATDAISQWERSW